MHTTKLLAASLGCLIIITATRAQEPMRLPEPKAKALPKNGAPVIEEEVRALPVAPVPVTPAHNHHAPVVDPHFQGYPYSGGWHAGYHHPLWDRPLALVVPPVSHYQTIWGWGISSTQITPIYPQYEGPAWGVHGDFPGHYQTPPYWPWDTRQFGVYYIRGPW